MLFAASEHMAVQATERPVLPDVMVRLGADAQAEGMTAATLQHRLAQLEAMTQARVLALARMAQLPADRSGRATSAQHALNVQGSGLEQAGDVVADGEMLAQDIAQGGSSMRRRVGKALGLKAGH